MTARIERKPPLNRSSTRFVTVNSLFDKAVRLSHGHRLFGLDYHPYHVASDLGIVATLICYFAFSEHCNKINFLSTSLAYIAAHFAYRAYLVFKARVFGIQSRSFIQDSICLFLPAYGLINFLLGNDLASAFDLLGVTTPLYVGILRVGCFLGGCCYGISSDFGVLYPSYIFRSIQGCRKYTPGSNPQQRVFPVQLVESACLLTISTLLGAWLWSMPSPRGFVLPLFF
jgi:phosphatidylglycerol---prolipoprotein diacylglyceryl transferase